MNRLSIHILNFEDGTLLSINKALMSSLSMPRCTHGNTVWYHQQDRPPPPNPQGKWLQSILNTLIEASLMTWVFLCHTDYTKHYKLKDIYSQHQLAYSWKCPPLGDEPVQILVINDGVLTGALTDTRYRAIFLCLLYCLDILLVGW